MKIVIAPDKFKGSLTSFEACAAIEEGIRSSGVKAEVQSFPMADGGDGFAAVLQHYQGSATVESNATDPLGRKITASYQWHADKKNAVIDLATTSGLSRLSDTEKNPLKTSSYGTGLLIKDALEKGATDITLGLGGSATNEAGMGILAALGFQFQDADGSNLDPIGESLIRIEKIIAPDVCPTAHFEIACDVNNILYGPQGAAYVYAGQKGASPDMIRILDEGLTNFAAKLEQLSGKSIASIPGTGAAGGIAAGLLTFFDANITSGIRMVIAASLLEDNLHDADLLITGEGKIDRQTLKGKVVAAIAHLAHRHQIPAIGFCGVIEADDMLLSALQLTAVESLCSPSVSVATAFSNARLLLRDTVQQYFQGNRKLPPFKFQ